MTTSDLPLLTIADINQDRCTGRYDPSPWVGEGWIGGIYLGGSRFIWGRFSDVVETECTCSFYPNHTGELSELSSGARHAFIDGYWGERAELILMEDRQWQRIYFEPSDMVRFPAQLGGWLATRSSPEAQAYGEVVLGGWDHEHCDICLKKIGRGGEVDGYFSRPDAWVCEECYTSFVAPKSLAFITM